MTGTGDALFEASWQFLKHGTGASTIDSQRERTASGGPSLQRQTQDGGV